jgi:hypothetical protein
LDSFFPGNNRLFGTVGTFRWTSRLDNSLD